MQDEFLLTVRGYELDSYGHLNHAVYLNHFEQARWEFFKNHQLLEKLTQDDLILVITESKVRYAREAVLFDPVIIRTRLSLLEPYLLFKQNSHHQENGLLIARAEFKTLFLHRQSRRPADIPDYFRMLLTA